MLFLVKKKKSKERLTVALLCDSEGSDNFKAVIIGKAYKPRSFKGKMGT
jgi:hypothetical protein